MEDFTMKKSIEKLLNRAKENGWSVTVDGNYINIGKYSPEGQDFSFDIDVTDFEEENDSTAAELFIESIHAEYDEYDVSYEAYMWLDDDGHGKNGAPYDMKDVYEDMEACKDMLWELYDDLHDFFYAEIYKED